MSARIAVGLLLAVGPVLLALVATSSAEAQVRRDGAWPSDEERVTLTAAGVSRSEAIQLLADKAGWSIVAHGLGNDTVDVRVKQQPAAQVLSLILADGAYVARRDGDMISVAPSMDVTPIGSKRCDDDEPRRQRGSLPPTPPVPPPPPGTMGIHGTDGREPKDRVVTAADTTLGVSDVVANLTVVAGNVDVYGTVTEDLTVFAGNVVLHAGAHVHGDVSSVAGNVQIEEGARIDGETSGVATQIDRTDDAVRDARRLTSDDDDVLDDEEPEPDPSGLWARLERAGNAVARSALLFAFGAVLLAIASRRVTRLEGEIATRPLRSFAVGALGLLLGLFTVVVTAVTIVGIPLALAAVLVGIVAGYIGMCAALTALGRALLRHKSPSAYLHLACGCALYLIASSLPGIGWLVTLAVVLIGIGALVSTRGADLFSRRPRSALAAHAGASDDAEGSDPNGL